jgi:hypothetical protein
VKWKEELNRVLLDDADIAVSALNELFAEALGAGFADAVFVDFNDLRSIGDHVLVACLG